MHDSERQATNVNNSPSLKPYPHSLKTNEPLNKKWGYSTPVKFVMCIYIVCFAFGGIRHWIDIWSGGLLPYTGIPTVFNIYLTSLAVFDFLVIVILFLRPIAGIVFALIIMTSDLWVDFNLCYTYWHSSIFENRGIQLLSIFGLFLFSTTPFLIININRLKKTFNMEGEHSSHRIALNGNDKI